VPVNEQGIVREFAPRVVNSLDANKPLTEDLRNMFVEAAKRAGFEDAVLRSYRQRMAKRKGSYPPVAEAWNKLTAAYAKVNPDRAMPEDAFRAFEVSVQEAMKDKGYDSVRRLHDDGRVTLVVFDRANLGDELAKTSALRGDGGSPLEQAISAFNVSVANDVGDAVSRTNVLAARVRVGVELQAKLSDMLETAVERADQAITRMHEADEALEQAVERATRDRQLRNLEEGRNEYVSELVDDIARNTDDPNFCL